MHWGFQLLSSEHLTTHVSPHMGSTTISLPGFSNRDSFIIETILHHGAVLHDSALSHCLPFHTQYKASVVASLVCLFELYAAAF
eukprot:m.1011189 g.1011189  ORF g.1011189 m.1011189 type:complete len:84 (-) comp24061_c0_seq46:2951-3202(-)